jgi:transcriptional regulator with PAS, ATPase and Fis domain
MLILPAITMERETHCGIEEHQHDESCYEERLICGQKEGKPHHHTDDCYTVEKELICKALERHKGKRKDAAKELGISERTLYRKINEYKINL